MNIQSKLEKLPFARLLIFFAPFYHIPFPKHYLFSDGFLDTLS